MPTAAVDVPDPRRTDQMRPPRLAEPSSFVFAREGARGTVWYAKYRLPDGRQVKKKIGPAFTGRGRPPAGMYTKRLAEQWLVGCRRSRCARRPQKRWRRRIGGGATSW